MLRSPCSLVPVGLECTLGCPPQPAHDSLLLKGHTGTPDRLTSNQKLRSPQEIAATLEAFEVPTMNTEEPYGARRHPVEVMEVMEVMVDRDGFVLRRWIGPPQVSSAQESELGAWNMTNNNGEDRRPTLRTWQNNCKKKSSIF